MSYKFVITPRSKLPSILLVVLLGACGTSGGRAPVEHRDVRVPGRGALVTSPGSEQPSAARAPVAPPPLAASASDGRENGPAPVESSKPIRVTTEPVRSGRVQSRPLAEAPRLTAPAAAPVNDSSASSKSSNGAKAPAKVSVLKPGPIIRRDPTKSANPPKVVTKIRPAKPDAPAVASAPIRRAKKPTRPVAPSAPAVANRPKKTVKPAAPVKKIAKITPKPAAKKTTSSGRFVWPAGGKVVQRYTDPKGIGIAGRSGDPVSAVADGKVIFSGLGPRGYGKLLIVKHDKNLLSVYGRNRSLLVREGQSVSKGQKIAEIGAASKGKAALLFEIRNNGKPVSPMRWLPKKR